MTDSNKSALTHPVHLRLEPSAESQAGLVLRLRELEAIARDALRDAETERREPRWCERAVHRAALGAVDAVAGALTVTGIWFRAEVAGRPVPARALAAAAAGMRHTTVALLAALGVLEVARQSSKSYIRARRRKTRGSKVRDAAAAAGASAEAGA